MLAELLSVGWLLLEGVQATKSRPAAATPAMAPKKRALLELDRVEWVLGEVERNMLSPFSLVTG